MAIGVRTAIVVTALLVGTGGCTMCPDPFDYSGPVPNGSSPQNDFFARSNGILPLRATPDPWPPVVSQPNENSTQSVLKAVEGDGAAVEETVAEVPSESTTR